MSERFEITDAMIDDFIEDCLTGPDNKNSARKLCVLNAFSRWLTLHFGRRPAGISRKRGDAARLHQAVRHRFGLTSDETLNADGHRVFPGVRLICP